MSDASRAKPIRVRSPRFAAVRPRQTLLVSVRNELNDALQRKFRAGDRLPSEPELAATYGVSRPTIREVLSGLERDGVVRRLHGVGTFVNEPKTKVTSSVDVDLGVTEAVMASNRRLGVQILANGTEAVPAEIATQLDIQANDKVLWIERIILADDIPAAYVVDVVPQFIAATAAEPYAGGSVYRFLEEGCHLNLLGGSARIDAVSATRSIARLLRVAPGTALLRLSQVERADGNVACLSSVEHYVSSVFDLNVRRMRRGGGGTA